MPPALVDRLRTRGAVLPDYSGRGLLNVPATVLAERLVGELERVRAVRREDGWLLPN